MSKLIKIGNSFALTIPKRLIKKFGFKQGIEFDVRELSDNSDRIIAERIITKE